MMGNAACATCCATEYKSEPDVDFLCTSFKHNGMKYSENTFIKC